jgi:hypothetical protein
MKYLNLRYFLKIRHRYKINISGSVLAVSFLGIYICLTEGHRHHSFFWVSLFFSVLVGSMSSLNDITTYGFIKALPSKVYAGFAAGTGSSGMIGSLVPIVTTILGFQIKWVNFFSNFLKCQACVILVPLFIYFVFLFNRTMNMVKNCLPDDKREHFEIKEVEFNKIINLKDFKTCVSKLKYYYGVILFVRI